MLSLTARPSGDRPTARPSVCAQCGGDADGGPVDGDRAFCCSGCQAAFGLGGVLAANRVEESTAARYADLDDPAFQSRHVKAVAGGPASVEFYLPNVHCASCVMLLERLPKALPGVADVRVDLPRKTASVRWTAAAVKLSAVAAALDGLGYPPHPVNADAKAAAAKAEERRQLARLAVAGACAGNAMLIALAAYLGAFSDLAAEHVRLFEYASMAVGLVAVFGPGAVFFRGAAAALQTRTPHMDLPVALGLGVGAVAGVANTLLHRTGNYFDSLSMLVFLLLVGRFLQFRQQRLAADSVSLLRGVMPRSARLVDGAALRTVPLDALAAGMVVEVRPGEVFPADGVLVAGATTVDQSLLTGESAPVPAANGEAVLGGTGNLGGVVRVRLSSVGAETRVGSLLRLAEESARTKPPIVEFADRMAGRFVIVVMFLALLSVAYWWSAGVGKATDVAVALLIVACPCALGLATPLALAVAQGQAARRGILVHSGDVFERLARPGRLWLDKTGTITVGRHTFEAFVGDDSARPPATALERRSSHPLGKALAAAAGGGDLPVEDFRQHQRGVSGAVDGRRWLVGSKEFLREQGVEAFPSGLCLASQDALGRGLTPVWIARDGAAVALAALGDRIRDDSAAAIASLKEAGWNVGLLSGDQPALAARVAAAVGIPAENVFGRQTPEDKLRHVTADRSSVMVGDGVNDAAALAAAGVGVAVHGGAETCLRAAPVYLSRPGLGPLVELVRGSRRVLRTVHVNYAVSLAYNLSFVALAFAGHVTPLVAALLMPVSSLTVVGVALSSRMFPESP
jgi:Cu2+-exporting ATPase